MSTPPSAATASAHELNTGSPNTSDPPLPGVNPPRPPSCHSPASTASGPALPGPLIALDQHFLGLIDQDRHAAG